MWVWCLESHDVCGCGVLRHMMYVGCGLQPILVAHDLSAMYVN